VGTVETFEPFMFEIPEPLEATSNPWIVSPVKVPTDVMLVWAATVTLKAVGTVETLEPFMFEIAEPLEATKRPWTFRPVKVPTLVTLGWAGVAKEPHTAVRFEVPETLSVVHETKGIVSVSKLKTVLVELDVNPAATRLVVKRVFVTFAL
jgi:hypothetical protein